jgi:phage/plasmid primase-like uncharacterized protein
MCDPDTHRRLETVQGLYQRAEAISRTIAETYLRKVRAIQADLGPDLRFLPKGTEVTDGEKTHTLAHGCLAVFGRNGNGDLSAVQLTALHPDGTKAYKRGGELRPKILYGVAKGSFARIQEDSSDKRVFIAEGSETALSIKEAGVKGAILASFGVHNIKNYDGKAQEIVICADNDGPSAVTRAVVAQAMETLAHQNHRVRVLEPSIEGQDFNDILRTHGAQALRPLFQRYIDQDFKVIRERDSKNRERT